MKRIQKLIIDSLGFSKTETNGFLIIISIVMAALFLPNYFIRIQSQPINSNDSDLKAWMDEIEASIEFREVNSSSETVSLRSFDPNVDDLKSLIESGFPERQARNLVAYRSKGGQFYDKMDVRKIYGITDSIFALLEPYIKISITKKEVYYSDKRENNEEKKPRLVRRFDLNIASVEDLMDIKGIGPVLSERILKYRSALGGFHSFAQLQEVYGLDSLVINTMINHVFLDSGVQQLSLNKIDSIKVLARHPYLSYSQSRSIINYKKVHGQFRTLDELLRIKIIDDSTYHKIAPYLSL